MFRVGVIFRGADALAEQDLQLLLTLSQPRAGDVRALVGAVLLGSIAGLAIGGAYLLGGGARLSATYATRGGAPVMQASLQLGRISRLPPVVAQQAAAPADAPRGWAGLRARFGLGSAASPFHLAAARDADLTCLAQVIYYEARGESPAGQAAVAQVVLNRVRHPAFPKTICGVAHQRSQAGCQFTFACKDLAAAPLEADAWRRSRRVADDALHGAVMAGVGQATHFQTARGGPFAGLLEVAQIGAHVFYRFGGRDGASGMFHQTPAPSRSVEAMEAPLSYEHVKLASLPMRSLGVPADAAGTDPAVQAPVLSAADQPKPAPVGATKADTPKPPAKIAPPPVATPMAQS